uniref:Solute carrier family 7 member 4 n=1 Tax=Ornithorhynchus anatinus TaxID=9258 RepID=A0A6I8N238_ORNAN
GCTDPSPQEAPGARPSTPMAPRLPTVADLAHLCRKLHRLKTLDADLMETSFQRCLSTADLALLGLGGMIGSGLYVLTGTVAKELAGPAVTVSFAAAGLASLLAALCYAEFGARVPRTGSAYMFTYVSVGELWAFLIGWNVLLEYLTGGAAVARAWSGTLDAILGHRVRNFTEAQVGHWQVPFLARSPDFLAAGVLLVASAGVACGARASSWLNHTFSAISMGVILLVVVLGFALAQPANWGPREGGFAPFGASGVLAGAATCFYAFVGFDVIAASSEEARDPRRSVPRATAVALGLAAATYVLVAAALTLMVPWHLLDPESALADAFYRRGYGWAGFLVAVGSLCAMNTVLLSNLFSLPRIAYAMAADGLFFPAFARLHPRTQVPVAGIAVFGLLMALLALLLELEALVQFLSIGTLLAYTFVAASVIVLRFRAGPGSGPGSGPDPVGPSPEGHTPEGHTPRDHGPSTPAPKEYESFSDKLQLVEAEPAGAPQPGQLRAAFRPLLGSLSHRWPGTLVPAAVGALVGSAVGLGCVLTFAGPSLPAWGSALLLLPCGLVFLISLLLLSAHQQQKTPDTFQIPLVPLTPALSVLLNVCLMLKLSPMTWVRFAIWLLVGLLVYFGYGIRHSKENRHEPRPDGGTRYVVFPSGNRTQTREQERPAPNSFHCHQRDGPGIPVSPPPPGRPLPGSFCLPPRP